MERRESVYLVPRSKTVGPITAMETATHDYLSSGARLGPITDRRVMELPVEDQQELGLAGKYWRVTIETFGDATQEETQT